jgi:hypothetical protein
MMSPKTIGVNLSLVADDTCLYATEDIEGYVLSKVQRCLNSFSAWRERWKIKISEKTLAIYFSHQRRPRCNLRKRMTWRLHIETIESKAFSTFIRIYPLFKSGRLSVNIKLTLHKALIRSVMTYACPAWELASETYQLKLQLLQNMALRTIRNLARRILVREMHVAFQIMQKTSKNHSQS